MNTLARRTLKTTAVAVPIAAVSSLNYVVGQGENVGNQLKELAPFDTGVAVGVLASIAIIRTLEKTGLVINPNNKAAKLARVVVAGAVGFTTGGLAGMVAGSDRPLHSFMEGASGGYIGASAHAAIAPKPGEYIADKPLSASATPAKSTPAPASHS